MNIIEKALFEWFPNMPAWVRVLTYLVFLFLFAYLLLTPRFVDGQMIWKDQATGGQTPSRATEIQMLVEGRVYKFVSNEQGFWSVPVISRLPQAIELQVFHEDKKEYFKVTIEAAKIWLGSRQEIVFSDKMPFVTLASSEKAPLLTRLAGMIALPAAHAGELKLPPGVAALSPADARNIHDTVFGTFSRVTGKPIGDLTAQTPFNGSNAPSYVQRMQIINELEKQYQIVIYDEHWRYMQNIGQLEKYLEDRLKLEKAFSKQTTAATGAPVSQAVKAIQSAPPGWATIQQRAPDDQKPVFQR
jgi:acyl carrier protein